MILPEQAGFLRYGTGLEYVGECLIMGFGVQRNLTDESSGESDVEVIFRIGFKNLGEFSSAGLSGINDN